MKPREFDDLVRQKFDQGDFAFNPANWDRMAEQLDGRAKKRSMFMWLWMPAVGMAASVALALGVTSMWQFSVPGAGGDAGLAHKGSWVKRAPEQQSIAMIPYVANNNDVATRPAAGRKAVSRGSKTAEKTPATIVSIKLQNMLTTSVDAHGKSATAVVNAAPAHKNVTPETIKKEITTHEPEAFPTFRNETHVQHKPINLSVIVAGGVYQGHNNSGYMAGATVRKMISDRVYVEGDVAFATSDNIQRTMYMDYSNNGSMPASGASGATAARPTSGAEKISSKTDADNAPIVPAPTGVAKMRDVSYNLYYAQVTPSIGYKIMKRMSVGMGPDFQQMLVDNRPEQSAVDRGTLQVVPTFDVGVVGKTEYALTQRVKAGVSYRKGINSVITMGDKYIDRDYIQFQMRCTIFNR